jgi:hypothetical protein
MEYRTPSDVEREMVRGLVRALTNAIHGSIPAEADCPGITGLLVTSMMHVAGELIQGVPIAERPDVVSYYQNYLADAAGVPMTRH